MSFTDESVVRRLSFIKYLYGLGIEQSKQSEPLNSVSVLSFHDSAELFLQLGVEHLNSPKTDSEFMSYWESLKTKLSSGDITQKESMRRLNKARVQLKHHGTMPSKLDIESFRATITNFFNENTYLVFGIEFNSISLLDLIQNLQAKTTLKKSQDLMNAGKKEESLKESAIAFQMLIDDYEKRKRTIFGRSPFFFGRDLTFNSSFFMHVEDRKMVDFIDKIKESIESIQNAIKILSLGFDYKKYAKFRLLTPYVEMVGKGNYVTGDISDEKSLSIDDCKFCIDYVIESAIKLQDFDYDAEKYILEN